MSVMSVSKSQPTHIPGLELGSTQRNKGKLANYA